MASSFINNDIRIVLVGKTGVGKSSLGNNLLQGHHFDTNAMSRSATSKCKYAYDNLRDGIKLCIVDTPGLFDTKKTNNETTMEIVRCIGLSSPGPHVFLFVLSISRFTKEEQDTVNHLVAVFGEDVIKHVVIVFTGKESLIYDNITLNEYLQDAPPELREVVQRCRSRCVTINNRADKAEIQADVDGIINIVRKTIKENGGSYYTGEMYRAAEEALREKMRLTDDEKHNKEKELQKRLDEFEQRGVEIEESATRRAREQEFRKQRLEAELAASRERVFKQRSDEQQEEEIKDPATTRTQEREHEKQRLEAELAESREREFKRRLEELEQREREIKESATRRIQEYEHEKQMMEAKLAALRNYDTRQQVLTEVEAFDDIVKTIFKTTCTSVYDFLPDVTKSCTIS